MAPLWKDGPVTITPADVTKATNYVKETMGPRDAWPEWQGGWPGEMSTALLDAVYSVRARYVKRWSCSDSTRFDRSSA